VLRCEEKTMAVMKYQGKAMNDNIKERIMEFLGSTPAER